MGGYLPVRADDSYHDAVPDDMHLRDSDHSRVPCTWCPMSDDVKPCPWCGDKAGPCEARAFEAYGSCGTHDMTRAAIILACAIRAAMVRP